ncbi:putative methyl-accepting chemotaxis protein [Azorhizobium caulinodans ORS 571]|uniref:Putative methyl-accepting chemotaxis protein n=1 Tax=Azorhizobium caulinodans (strain ATCC 43989 / DSM 5975 / JCM 20966 / LMG 6465 / NBRC 14845 / NCIMB 13405 / ORS 571) TaxID=438753 RepID=A8HXW2_AZOC5|nr:methyl-accepting chemotaxis protein [Azorhizobium caulinodans]BAF87544.1 putative methyl-accepting chemotaxis protein [Azorhizobium caulinodans ORS 571]
MAVAAFPFRRDTASIGAAAQFLDNLPSAVMLCEPQNLVICYLNKASVQLLKSIEHVLPVKADQVLGSSIDIFHKNPSHQRRLLADPKNLPHTARIKAGDEILELNINAVRDARGAYAYVQLTWSVITKAVEHEEKTERLLQMIEEMPINVMTCTLDDFRIDFANRASRETLKRIEQYLPVKAADLIGTSIDVFHKAPAHQRRMLADPSNLPHQANIKVGPETLRLRVSAIKDQKGNYVGPMVTWAVVTESVALANSVNEVVGSMTDTSAEMQQSSSRLLELTQSSDQTAAAVSAAAVEMSASFDEISSQIRQATGMSQDVAERARSTDQLVSGLTESVERIGAFTALIDKIAAQTNLLALNATIEAARVGEAGKGFAVVAQEVKALAMQTANATQDIRQQVSAVQTASEAAATAVSDISGNVRQLSEVFTALSAGVEEQVVTNRSVSQMITGVSDTTGEIRDAALRVRSVADQVGGCAGRLTNEVGTLLKT